MSQLGPKHHLDPKVRQLEPSATLAINERSAQLEREGRRVFRLGLGQSPFPVPEWVVEELRQRAHEKDYLPVTGLEPLRAAVSDYHNRRDAVSTSADDVLIGPGSKELLFLAQLCYGGTLLLPSPSWVSYQPQASLLGLPTRWIPTTVGEGWRLTPEALFSATADIGDAPALLILNYPNNPAGTTLETSAMEAIGRVCRQRRLLVISDEIYGEVHHHGLHKSLAAYYPEGTVIASGLSKWCGAGGWRLGTFTFPKNLNWLRGAMAAVASETFTSVSAPIQWAAVKAFSGGTEMEDYLSCSRRVLRAVGELAWKELCSMGLDVPKPDGGFYLFPDASRLGESLKERGVFDSVTFCEILLQETGVATLPGNCFGRPASELSFRLATVDFDGAKALEAAARQGERLEKNFVHEFCPNLVEALGRLRDWMGSDRMADGEFHTV